MLLILVLQFLFSFSARECSSVSLFLKFNFSHKISYIITVNAKRTEASFVTATLLWCFTAVLLRHLQTPDTMMSYISL